MNNNIIKFQLPNADSKYVVNPEAFDAALKSEDRDGCEVTLTFDGAVTSIGSNAITSEDTLVVVELPKSIESINGCSFRCAPKNIKTHLVDEDGFVIQDGVLMAIFVHYPKKIAIPEGVTTIGPNALHKKCVSEECEIKFPKSLRRIEHHAFHECGCKFKLNEGLEYIGDFAFTQLQNKTLTIPSSVKYIGDSGFAWAGRAEKIVIKHEIDHIGRGAFGGYSSLKEVEGVYAVEDGTVLIKDDILLCGVCDGNTLFSKGKTKGIEIPAGTKILDENSLCQCSLIPSLPDSLLEIRKGAFCHSDIMLRIPESVEIIEDDAFLNANVFKFSGKFTTDDGNFIIVNKRLVYASPKLKDVVIIPEGTESIAPHAFTVGTFLQFNKAFPKFISTLILPAEIQSIDMLAFGYGIAPYLISIGDIIINANQPFDWDMKCISLDANIYVPDEAIEIFKTAYHDRADKIKGKSILNAFSEIETNGIRFTLNGKTLVKIQRLSYGFQEIDIPEGIENIADNLEWIDFKRSDLTT